MQTPAEQRRAILRAHAKLGPNGRLSRCRAAARAGLVSGTNTGQGKVTFPTQRAALKAAALLKVHGSFAQEPYECRDRPGHWHLHKAKGTT